MHVRYDYTDAHGWSFRRIAGGSDELLSRLRHTSALGVDPSPRDFPLEATVVGMEVCLGGWLAWLRPEGEYALDIHYVTGIAGVEPNPFQILRERGALPAARKDSVEWSAVRRLPRQSARPIDLAPSLDYLGAAERLFALEAVGRSKSIRYYLSVTRSDQHGSADAVGAWFRFDAEAGVRTPEELRCRLEAEVDARGLLGEEQLKPAVGPSVASLPAVPATDGQSDETEPCRAETAADLAELRREVAGLREQVLAERTAPDLARRLVDLEAALAERSAPPATGGGRRALFFPIVLTLALAGTIMVFQAELRSLSGRMATIVPFNRLEALEQEVARRVSTEILEQRLEKFAPLPTVNLLRAEYGKFVTIDDLSQLRDDVARTATTQDVEKLAEQLAAIQNRIVDLERAMREQEKRLEGLVPMGTLDTLRAEQAEFVTTGDLSQLRADVAGAATTRDIGSLEKQLVAIRNRVSELERVKRESEPGPREDHQVPRANPESMEGGRK